MARLSAYIVTGAIVVAGALWLGSGMLVNGGNGPGRGEAAISDVLAGKTIELTPEQQALVDEADAKAKAAAEAKKTADAAAAEAAKAKSTADVSTTAELQKELTAKAAEAKAASDEAKKLADEAAKRAKEAEAEAEKVHEELNATKSITERQSAGTAEETPLQSVRTETFAVQAYPIEVPLRGRTKAKSSVTVTPETSGTVTEVKVAKGQTVSPGDVICTLDPGDRAAAVAQAEASLAQAQLQFDTNAELRKKGVAASNTANQAEVGLKAAQVAYDSARTELERTNVKTKVAGVVQDPVAELGSMLTPGAPCATVVQLDPMLFVGTVPESQIKYAKTGLTAQIDTVTGQTVDGKVSYVASMADDATRSFAVEIEVPNKDGAVLSGITATATVNVGTLPAHKLPQSVLTLDDDGALGIRAVKDGKVEFYPVTIVSDSREGVWVTGLPATLDIITLGQEFVTAGQEVDATNVAATASAGDTAVEGAQS